MKAIISFQLVRFSQSAVLEEGRWHGAIVIILASRPIWPGFDSQHSRTFSEEKLVDVAEVSQRHCSEEIGQWLEYVNQTHLVLVTGKLALQKRQ